MGAGELGRRGSGADEAAGVKEGCGESRGGGGEKTSRMAGEEGVLRMKEFKESG